MPSTPPLMPAQAAAAGVLPFPWAFICLAPFAAELLKQLKENGINTAVDTCGFVSREVIDLVLPYTDTFLYDLKAFDEDLHIRCTGQSNKRILENLLYLDSVGASIEVRIPFVPDHNDGQMQKLADFLRPVKHVKKVKVLPYHNYAGSKYAALGMENTLPHRLPAEEEINQAQSLFS